MTDFAREYGEGLYALAAEESLEEKLLEECEALRKIFRAQPDFLRLLGNLSLPKEERLQILDGALRGQVHVYLLNFLKLLCERSAIHEFEACAEAYRGLYNHAHGVVEAVVTTSAPLTDDQRMRLQVRLKQMTGKTVMLREQVDASVMGGVVLEMDGKRYDNSVATRLETMRRVIAGQA